ESSPVPTKLNPMGAKGAGEAGTVGALPAVINAVMDALAPLGVRDLDMPASSARVWQALQEARPAGQARRPRSSSTSLRSTGATTVVGAPWVVRRSRTVASLASMTSSVSSGS